MILTHEAEVIHERSLEAIWCRFYYNASTAVRNFDKRPSCRHLLTRNAVFELVAQYGIEEQMANLCLLGFA
jgi:hypothetical protein